MIDGPALGLRWIPCRSSGTNANVSPQPRGRNAWADLPAVAAGQRMLPLSPARNFYQCSIVVRAIVQMASTFSLMLVPLSRAPLIEAIPPSKPMETRPRRACMSREQKNGPQGPNSLSHADTFPYPSTSRHSRRIRLNPGHHVLSLDRSTQGTC